MWCAYLLCLLQQKNKAYAWLLILNSLALVSTTIPVAAQGWSAELFGGTAWSLPLPLHIEQPNEPPLHIHAHYSTRPFWGSPYYAYRLGYRGWEAEMVHHKLYLKNPPPQVQHFEISHGYNLAMVNRSLSASPFIIRFGLGLVIAHPEGMIRGQSVGPVKSLLGGGYHISGISFQVAVAHQLEVSSHWFITPEVKFTAAWARVPLAGGGWAEVPNLALHTLAGIGYRTSGR